MNKRLFILESVCLLAAVLFLSATADAQITKAGRAYVDYTVLPEKAVVAVGEDPVVRVVATAGGAALEGVTLKFEAGPDNLPADRKGEAVFHNGEARASFGRMDKPGFRWCQVSFTVDGTTFRDNLKVGCETQSIKASVAEPKDFDAFWSKTLKKASKVPMTYEMIPDDTYSSDKVECFLVKLQAYEKGHYIYGWLLRPRDGEKHPVLFNPPGAGVKRIGASPEYAEQGYIIFCIGINGIPVNAPDSVLQAHQLVKGDYERRGLESPEEHYLRKVYASCVRCIDFLVSLPEWDGKNVGVTGGSQGGALTIVTAALDPRVTFLSSFYPALCDISGYARGGTGGWPNLCRNGQELRNFPRTGKGPYDYALTDESIDLETALRTLSYFDVANFASRVKAPGFYCHGYNDNTCPPTSVCAAFNRIQAPKTMEITPSSSHWRFAESQKRGLDWMRSQWK